MSNSAVSIQGVFIDDALCIKTYVPIMKFGNPRKNVQAVNQKVLIYLIMVFIRCHIYYFLVIYLKLKRKIPNQ